MQSTTLNTFGRTVLEHGAPMWNTVDSTPVWGWEPGDLCLRPVWRHNSNSSGGRPADSDTTGWRGGPASRWGRAWKRQKHARNPGTFIFEGKWSVWLPFYLGSESWPTTPQRVKLLFHVTHLWEATELHTSLEIISHSPHLREERVHSLPAVDVQNGQPEFTPRGNPNCSTCTR